MNLPSSKPSWGLSTLRKEALSAGQSRPAAGEEQDDMTTSGGLTLCLIYFQGLTWIVSLNGLAECLSGRPPRVGIYVTPISQMRKLRLIEGSTLLKVTRLGSTRLKIQIQTCLNPDAKSFPSVRPPDPALKGPMACRWITEITT